MKTDDRPSLQMTPDVAAWIIPKQRRAPQGALTIIYLAPPAPAPLAFGVADPAVPGADVLDDPLMPEPVVPAPDVLDDPIMPPAVPADERPAAAPDPVPPAPADCANAEPLKPTGTATMSARTDAR